MIYIALVAGRGGASDFRGCGSGVVCQELWVRRLADSSRLCTRESYSLKPSLPCDCDAKQVNPLVINNNTIMDQAVAAI